MQGTKLDMEAISTLPDTCVTVYGYASEMSSAVLADMGKCGYVLDYRVVTDTNWMHLRFEDARQAAQVGMHAFGEVLVCVGM